jgi:effector-binding domain-containing protein
MKYDNPRIEFRNAVIYAAIRKQVAMQNLHEVSACLSDVYSWLAKKNIETAGPPFYRYLSFEENGLITLDIGIPSSSPVEEKGKIVGGSLPAGHYAFSLYTGDFSGLQLATSGLLDWAALNRVEFKKKEIGNISFWDARLENYLTDPEKESDPEKWQTEIAILIV